MQAALPMYLVAPEALQAFWAALATLLRTDPRTASTNIPATLSPVPDCHAQWLAPDLLLSQACGYPLMTQLAGRVQLVGSLAYEAEGVHGIHCRSPLICRTDDHRRSLGAFAGSRLAYNDTISQSGYNALRALVASQCPTPRPFFGARVMTGAHARSIDAVRSGMADLAALDPVSWALWQAAHPNLCCELRVLGHTEAYPGLPLITSLQTPPPVLAALRAALLTLATDPAYAALRAPLHISGFVATHLDDYQRCLDLQEQARAQGLLTL